MAEPEIKIGVTADVDAAQQAISRLGDTCDSNAAKLERVNFDKIAAQQAELVRLSGQMGKSAENVQAFSDRLQVMQAAQEKGVGVFDKLSGKLRELEAGLKSGNISTDEAVQELERLHKTNKDMVQAVKQLFAEKRKLTKEQTDALETVRQEAAAYQELNEAAKKELQTVEEAGVKKAQARDREKASIKELQQALLELDTKINDARQSGHTVGELAGVKEQLAIIDALERKEAVQRKADAAAQARIDNIRRSAELEVASIDQISAKIKELQAAYKNARQTGDKQGELQYLQQMKQALDVKKQKLAEEERAQKAAAQAMEQAAAAAKKHAAEEAAAAEKVRLSTMNVRELSKEVRALMAARRAAANAGDTQAVAAYTAKIKLARTALRDMKNEANLARAALLGKAQAGMTAAQQLGSLALSAKDGSLNMANLANTIMSVSLAIKAGLGPIGWIMMAIQGLQMAWDYFSEKQKKATKAMQEAKEAMVAMNKAMAEYAKTVQDANFDRLTASIERQTKAIDKKTEATLRAHDAETKAAADAAALEIKRVEMQNNAEKAHMRGMVERHQMSEREMMERSAELDANLARMQTEANEAAQKAQQKRLEIEQKGTQRVLQVQQGALAGFERAHGAFFTSYWTDEVDAKAEDFKRRMSIYEADVKRLTEKKNQLGKELEAYKATGNDVAASQTRAALRSTESAIKDAQGKLQEQHENFKAYLHGLQKEGDKNNEEIFKLSGEAFTAAALNLREKGKELQESIEENQKQLAEGADALTDVKRAQKLAKDEAIIRTETNKQLLDEQRAALDAKEAQERARKAQEEFAAYMQQCASEAQEVVNKYRTIGSYAAQSAKMSEERTLLEDQWALNQRRLELETILGRELDEQTRQKITAQLEATNQEIQGLCAAMGRAKRSAERWLRELEPPDIKGKSKAAQSAIKRLAKGYQRAAQRAEKAARSGNEKAQQRAERSMDRYARNMARNAKHAGDVDELHRQTKDKLEVIKHGVTKQAASTVQTASASARTVTSTAADMATVTNAAQSVTAAQEASSAQIDQLGQVFTGMADASNRSADSITRLASIVTAALDKLEKRLTEAEQQVKRLETRV